MQNDATINAGNAGLSAIAPAHAQATQTAATGERLHGLDALRAGALLLGVLLHASISFLPGAKFFWMVSDNQKTALLGPVFFVIHIFRMPLFFMLAGYFAHLVLQKKGWAGFIKDRLKRITLPLLLGWPVIFAAIVAAIVLASWVRNGGSLPQKSPPPPTFTADSFPLAHLWFLYMLTLLYAVYLGLWAVCRQLGILPQLKRCADWLMPVISGWFGPMLLALPVALALFYALLGELVWCAYARSITLPWPGSLAQFWHGVWIWLDAATVNDYIATVAATLALAFEPGILDGRLLPVSGRTDTKTGTGSA